MEEALDSYDQGGPGLMLHADWEIGGAANAAWPPGVYIGDDEHLVPARVAFCPFCGVPLEEPDGPA